jgi:ATP-dependent Clp protease ATP-binding subunit ClpC
MAIDSAELSQIAAEAADLARGAAQPPSTAHLLLAIFTVPGPADVLLRERGCDEDAVLLELARAGAPREAEGTFAQALERARQLADDCQSERAEGLHLLVALTRLSRSVAAMLLEKSAPPVASLRTTALGYLTGAVPRRRARPALDEVPVAQPLPSLPARVSTLPPPAPGPGSLPGAADAASSPAALYFAPQPGLGASAEAAPALSTASPARAAASAHALDPREYPFLCTHGRNLSLLAAQGLLDPALGREREVEEVLDILGKRRANNPVLVGEPGVGKTAIVEGLAQRLVAATRAGHDADGVPADPRVIVELDVSGLVAGTQLRGSFSERLLGIKDEVKRALGRVVVFIDELHMLIGAGSAGEGPQDAANELKAALARGEFPCVGATTHDEFRKHIQGDPALERRFVPVLVREPSPRETQRILEGAARRYEEHHRVAFSAEALEAAATLTARYVRDRCLPDKAFAAIDLAGSRARREGRAAVSRDDVARSVARMAGLPEERLLAPDGERYLSLERRLAARVVGHEANIGVITRAIRRNYAGFSAQRPLASFLLVGPSGVGKTETARALALELDAELVRLDLSEYAEAHSVARLVGAPPGYVGYGEGGQLTEAVRRKPASVVLLDEVEKAHPSVLQLLLQVLDEGALTDGRGRRIDFSGTILVLTSNLGAAAFGAGASRAVGFGAGRDDPSLAKTLPPAPVEHPQAARALEQARAGFAPELWARLDERLVFAPLAREEVARIAQLLLADSSRRLWDERRIAFRTGPGLVEHLIDAGGFQPSLGARPMRQTIQRLVESPLADEILAGRVRAGEKLLARAAPRGGVEFILDGAEPTRDGA